MDGLKVIPVDKSQLRKLVDDSRKYVEKLNEYTAQSGQILWEHLRRLKIFRKQDATKEEVDQACANLRNAVFGLRLIPSKENWKN